MNEWNDFSPVVYCSLNSEKKQRNVRGTKQRTEFTITVECVSVCVCLWRTHTSVCICMCVFVCVRAYAVLTVTFIASQGLTCVVNVNVTFWMQITLEQIPIGRSVPEGQQTLDFINMQMLPSLQCGASVTCWGNNKNKLKLNQPNGMVLRGILIHTNIVLRGCVDQIRAKRVNNGLYVVIYASCNLQLFAYTVTENFERLILPGGQKINFLFTQSVVTSEGTVSHIYWFYLPKS